MSKHLLQRLCRDGAVRGVADRLAPDQTDHLRRLVHHPGALGDGEREGAVLPDKHLDAARVSVRFGKSQELGPSSG